MIKHIVVIAAAAMMAACTSQPAFKISDVTEARALSDHALDLFAAGDTKNAVAALDAVIAYGTVDDADYARRAAVHGTLKNYDKALADANRAIELAPRVWRRYLERAVLYQRVGRYDEAIGDLDSAVALQPNEVELLRRRAYLKIVAARFNEAVVDYENLTQVPPRSDTGALGRGTALYLAGRWQQAAAQFKDLLTASPEDGLAALWFAKAKLRDGQFLTWDELERSAGPEPEWLLTRLLLTATADTEASNATTDVDPCERALFLGLRRIVRDGGQNAADAFRAAAETCPLDSIEASEARTELMRLKIPAG